MMAVWPKLPAVGPYLVSIVSGVHEIIQIVNALSRQARQWNGRLRVMQRCRRQETTHRHAAIGRVDMQLVANPRLSHALGVFLHPDVTRLGQLRHHLRPCHGQLPLQAGEFLGPLLALSWPSPLALGRGLSLSLRHGFLAALNRRGIARDMPDQVVLEGASCKTSEAAGFRG